MKADFHVHSAFSVGGVLGKPHASESVEQILERAEQEGIKMLSISDHDNTLAYSYILNNPQVLDKFSGRIVPAVEANVHYNGTNIHAMLYGFKLEDSERINNLTPLVKARGENLLKRQQERIEKLKRISDTLGIVYDKKFTITQDGLCGHDSFCEHVLSKPENVGKLSFSDMREFYYDNLLNEQSPWYLNFSEDLGSLQELYDEVKKVDKNIIVSLCHIGQYAIESRSQFIREVRPYIDAIEVMHWSHIRALQEECCKLADELGLYKFGGSDFHTQEQKLGMWDNSKREINTDSLRLPENIYNIHGKKI